MTREEAIEVIGQSIKPDVDMAKVADAIKALEQEPQSDIEAIRREIEQTVSRYTIAELIKDLTEYAEDSENGFDTEVRSYVGMSRQAAEERLKECEYDEYVFDDFLPISYVHEIDGFVYIRTTDIPEVEPQESEDKK